MANRYLVAGMAVVSAALGLSVSRPVAAGGGSIQSPGDHPHYVLEAEPHLALSYAAGVGPGFRGTFVIFHNGFVPSINNSVGFGVGAEWLFYNRHCVGPKEARVCERVGDVMVPIVIQWNFWLDRLFSVFGEPGVALHFRRGPDDGFVMDPFTIFVGARIHFSGSFAITFRMGSPEIFHHDSVITIGASFLI